VFPAGFDPDNLSASSTLNKSVVGPVGLRFVDLEGRTGADLLSRDALLELLRTHLGEGAHVDPAHVADAWSAALSTQAVAARDVAASVADEVARRLVALVASLVLGRGGTVEPMAHPGERRAWAHVEEVTLGGGLLAGEVGPAVVDRLTKWMDEVGTPLPPIRMGPHPSLLALIGAARSLEAVDGQHVVLDAGQTAIKRGVASVAGGQLVGLRMLPAVAVEGVAEGNALRTLVEGAITDTVREVEDTAPRPVVMSVANYLRDGRPSGESPSPYESLRFAGDDFEQRVGREVRMVHDGTAAWRAAATPTPSAVIVLGTWLGVGFGPQRAPLLPGAPSFRIHV